MNAFKILFIISLIFYFTIYEPGFWKYYFAILIPYWIITQYLMNNNEFNTPKRKSFISMWTAPFDPQIMGKVKVEVTKVEKFLEQYNNKNNTKIDYLTFIAKIMGHLLKKYPRVNGNVLFGRLIPRETLDVSIVIASNDMKSTDILTIKNVDKLNIKDLHNEITEGSRKILESKDVNVNRRNFLAKIIPTFILSPFVRFSSFLSTVGFDLSFIGLPKQAYGTFIINPLYITNLEDVYLPILPFAYAPAEISICKKREKVVKEGDLFIEKKMVNLGVSLDHRYLDGAQGTLLALEIKRIHEEPHIMFE